MTTACSTPTSGEQGHPAPASSTATLAFLWTDRSGVDHETPIGSTPLTLGGGPKCTLRFAGPGIKPIHCVVKLTDGRPVARRWANKTLLNGKEFTESLLEEGDLLQVAETELLVVPINSVTVTMPSEAAAHQQQSEPTAAETPTETAEKQADAPDWEGIVARLQERARQNQARAKRLATALRELRVASDQLQEYVESILVTEADESPQENESPQECANQQETVDEWIEPSTSFDSEFANEPYDEPTYDEPTQEEDASLEPVDEWSFESSLHDESCSEYDTPVEYEQQVEEQQLEEQQLDELEFAIGSESQGEPTQEEPSHEETSFYEKFSHMLTEDGQEEVQTPIEAKAPAITAAEPAIEPDDECLDSYMQDFMQRLGCKNEEKSTEALIESLDKPEKKPEQEAKIEFLAPEEPLTELPEKRTEDAPERLLDMDELRSLANASARDAIEVANQNRKQESALLQLALTGSGLLVSTMICYTATSLNSAQFVCGALGCIATTIFGAQVMREGIVWLEEQLEPYFPEKFSEKYRPSSWILEDAATRSYGNKVAEVLAYETPMKEVALEKSLFEEAPANEATVSNDAFGEETLVEFPTEETPAEHTPIDDAPEEDAPASEASVEEASGEEDSGEEARVETPII